MVKLAPRFKERNQDIFYIFKTENKTSWRTSILIVLSLPVHNINPGINQHINKATEHMDHLSRKLFNILFPKSLFQNYFVGSFKQNDKQGSMVKLFGSSICAIFIVLLI